MTNNEQWNAQLKKLSGDSSLEGVISNHCDINQRDVELLEGLYRVAWEARQNKNKQEELN